MAESTGSRSATGAASPPSSTNLSTSGLNETSLDQPDRRAALLAAKLGGLVASRWGPAERDASPFPGGSALIERAVGWVLLDAEGDRRLGASLVWASKRGARRLHLLVDDPDVAAVLARRAALFANPPAVWEVHGRDLVAATPALYPPLPALSPAAQLMRAAVVAAGAEAVVEQGELLAEVRGLEVARTRAEGSEAHLDVGVGRFDREAFALMNPDLPDAEALAKAIGVVRAHRRADAPRHPLNQLAPERWQRALLVADPSLVGAAELEPVEPAVPRRNLKDRWPASAVGTDVGGQPLVVTCSTSTDLELVACGADDRARYRPDARLVLVTSGPDTMAVTTVLAAALHDPAEVATLPSPWGPSPV